MVRESTSAKGARLELLVAVDMMRQGWSVFIAASPVGKTDLVGIKRNTILKIQRKSRVKDWERSLTGNNVLAVATDSGPVRYFSKRKLSSAGLFETIEVLKRRRK